MAGTRWFNLCTVKGLKTQFVLRYRCYFQSGARQSRICVAVTDFLNLDQLVRLNTRWLVHRMTIHTRRLKVIVPETNQHVKISLFSTIFQSTVWVFSQSTWRGLPALAKIRSIELARVLASDGIGSLPGRSGEGYHSGCWRPEGLCVTLKTL